MQTQAAPRLKRTVRAPPGRLHLIVLDTVDVEKARMAVATLVTTLGLRP